MVFTYQFSNLGFSWRQEQNRDDWYGFHIYQTIFKHLF